MKKRVEIKVLSLSILCLIFIIIFAYKFIIPIYANPPTFQQFYGQASYSNSSPIRDNTEIEIKFNSELKITCSIKDGEYGFNPHCILENLENGNVLKFYINDEEAGETIFSNFGLTEIDLVLESETAPVAPNTPAPSSSGGGGGGGSISTPAPKITGNVIANNSEEENSAEENETEFSSKITGKAIETIKENPGVVPLGIAILAIAILLAMIILTIRKIINEPAKI